MQLWFAATVAYLARTMAIVGGLVLLVTIAMCCASIFGRAFIVFGLSPVPGDFEWVEMGIAFAIFSFLPWCNLQRRHATVNLLRPIFSGRINSALDVLSDLLMLGIAVLIVAGLWAGMRDKMGYAETTQILQFPVWIAYAAGLPGALLLVLTGISSVLRTTVCKAPVITSD